MCNSSIQGNVSMFKEYPQWHCMCQERFGSLVVNIVATLFFFVGTPISCWSLWVFLHRNAANLVFSISITLLELFYCFIGLFDLILANSVSLPHYQLIVFFLGLHWTIRPLLQICMCFEHYLAVIYPVTFLKYNDIQYRIALSVLSCLIGLANCLRLLFIETPFYPDHLFFVFFCIAVIVISFCCISVLHALKHPGPGDVEMTEKDRHNKPERGRAVENQQKRKAFRIISHILISILVCFIPQVIAYFLLIAEISSYLYVCTTFPIILFFTMLTILCSPLLRMYSEGHMKNIICFMKA